LKIIGGYEMRQLSLLVPNEMAKNASEAAKYLNITRTELIRSAIDVYLEQIKKQKKKQEIAEGLILLSKNKEYLALSEELDGGSYD
jgi:metal-responsive CopG/Arc/MetJ family transcriptional regulator